MCDEAFEQRLREQGERLPVPDGDATERIRQAVLAAATVRQYPKQQAPWRSRRVAAFAIALALAVASGFGGGYGVASTRGDGGETAGDTLLREVDWNRIGTGVTIEVPAGWDGRVLYRDATGLWGAIFQVANFTLPGNEGLDPPKELPPGKEDPIKAMGPEHVLITITTNAADDEPAPQQISFEDLRLLPFSAPRVPRGHTFAQGTFCYRFQCLLIEVDFGGRPPQPELIERVDDILGSVSVAVDQTRR
jgi:hypothetical protein